MTHIAPDRRIATRYNLPAAYTPVAVRLLHNEGFDLEGHAYDISVSGLRFELDRPVAPGTQIAMRIALPPIINQYLNYVKNTSLAIAVGFAEVTLIAFQAIGNGQPAPQVVILLMGSYLIFSLVISLLVNLYNRHLRIVTR